MNDLARLVLGEEGTTVKLCMQHGFLKEGAGAGAGAGAEGRRNGRGKRDEFQGRGNYEIFLLRSRPQTTQAPLAQVRQGRYRQHS